MERFLEVRGVSLKWGVSHMRTRRFSEYNGFYEELHQYVMMSVYEFMDEWARRNEIPGVKVCYDFYPMPIFCLPRDDYEAVLPKCRAAREAYYKRQKKLEAEADRRRREEPRGTSPETSQCASCFDWLFSIEGIVVPVIGSNSLPDLRLAIIGFLEAQRRLQGIREDPFFPGFQRYIEKIYAVSDRTEDSWARIITAHEPDRAAALRAFYRHLRVYRDALRANA